MIIDLLQKSRQQRTRRVFRSSWKMHCVANHCRNVSLTIISSKLIRRPFAFNLFSEKAVYKESGLSILKPQNMAEWKWSVEWSIHHHLVLSTIWRLRTTKAKSCSLCFPILCSVVLYKSLVLITYPIPILSFPQQVRAQRSASQPY